MKSLLGSAYYIMGTLLIVCSVSASPDCLDNSYHANRCLGRYDYKNYHSVHCDCRCERYARSLDRGTCRRCQHYRIPYDPKLHVKKQ